jgi:hypothetical protein
MGSINYEDLDLDVSVVLNQYSALGYLRWVADEYLRQAFEDVHDYEVSIEQLKDVIEMYKEIKDKDYHWVKFDSCPMSASNIMITEMVEK